jgi:hypothetical protein
LNGGETEACIVVIERRAIIIPNSKVNVTVFSFLANLSQPMFS